MNSEKLLEIVVKAADEKMALDIVALDMSEVSGIADNFVIMEAMNVRQIDAIVDNIVDKVEEAGVQAGGHIEGEGRSGWVLIDLGDVIVSVFGHDERGHYNLEKLWSDAPLVNISSWVSE
ncbi:ribosome silencing factor [Lactococcus nasutitermitis]|uniref:Ribosomal silencing factor RsfS n=1 Tax=Lactococcus nasutitermitis TaxID=1652957 RepID=A0ABV9JFJ5_9LACT|nr:ribosome silencing factor [Lactococcus nasutitermitis]